MLAKSRMNFSLLWKSIFFLCVLFSFTLAQDLGDGEEVVDPQVERKATRIATEYERTVNTALSAYFDPRSYVVDARVVLEEMLVPIKERRKGLNTEGVEELPGLPVVPEDLRPGKSRDTLAVVDYRKDFGVKFVDIKIFVDSTLKSSDIDFIMELITAKTKLDQIRGDQLEIVRKSFPKKANGEYIAPVVQDSSRPVQNSIDSSFLRSLIPTKDSLTWTSSVLKNSGVLFPLLILCLFVLFLAWMIFKFIQRLQKDRDLQNQQIVAIQEKLNQLQAPASPSEESNKSFNLNLSAPVVEDENRFKELRSSVIDAVIGRPQVCAKILSSWVASDSENGPKNAATLLNASDSKLFEIIRGYLSPVHAQKLQWRLSTLNEEELPRQLEILLSFKKDLSQYNTIDNQREGDIFNFLNQMNIAQISHLLKDESAGIRGLALAQIHSDKAADLLQKMEDHERADTLVSMGQIQNVSIDSYKQVAIRLSQKALDVSNMRFVSSDGVESIIDIVFALPVANQKAYLDGVAEMDLTLAQKIRRFYVPMESLPRLETKLLAELLSDIDRDVLSLALSELPNEYVISVLNSLPERMQQMVLSGIQSQTGYSREDQEKARKTLLNHIRVELKKRGGAQL